jgi:metallo-beta-lactamase family protein
MSVELQFFGATGEVTGSLYVIRAGTHTVLLECGLIQGGAENEERNRDSFPVAIEEIDAVILSHAHIDHSGRIPLLFRRGYDGPVYAHHATRALCEIMLPDSGYLNEKEAERENRKRRGTGKPFVQPLYAREDGEKCLGQFESSPYGQRITVLPGLTLCFHDAGHILGSTIVELEFVGEDGTSRLIFSGDLGYRDAPVMNPPATFGQADVVLMESTYGDRLHRPMDDTLSELGEVFESARANQGNILDLLYLMAENFERWKLDQWDIFLDSPMGIEATDVYAKFRHLYGAELFKPGASEPALPNLYETRAPEESMKINDIRSGAIIIAGSGMCSGGRILHHLKNNIWRPECHLLIIGYQAIGTLGRRIVDGAEMVKLWGDSYRVRIQVHTVGGLSAHGDQADLIAWYRTFENAPPVYLVHGEQKAQEALADKMRKELGAPVTIASREQKIEVGPGIARTEPLSSTPVH